MKVRFTFCVQREETACNLFKITNKDTRTWVLTLAIMWLFVEIPIQSQKQGQLLFRR